MKTSSNRIARINCAQLWCVIFITLLSTSCVSYKPVSMTSLDKSVSKAAVGPGNVLKITLKSGEKIMKLKVKEIDSEKISGIQMIEIVSQGDERTQWRSVNKTIPIADIQSLKKRKFSPGKTIGITVGGLLLVASIAVASDPVPSKIYLPPNLFKP